MRLSVGDALEDVGAAGTLESGVARGGVRDGAVDGLPVTATGIDIWSTPTDTTNPRCNRFHVIKRKAPDALNNFRNEMMHRLVIPSGHPTQTISRDLRHAWEAICSTQALPPQSEEHHPMQQPLHCLQGLDD